MGVPNTVFEAALRDNFNKTHGYNGSSRLQHLARARNGFRYNAKAHFGSVKRQIKNLLSDEDRIEKIHHKMDRLHQNILDIVDEEWTEHRETVQDMEEKS